jgi:hypothetical protein
MTTAIHLVGVGLTAKRVAVRRTLGTADNMDEARELAIAFLSDPRDTIESVHFFEVGRQRFNGWLNREALRKSPQP